MGFPTSSSPLQAVLRPQDLLEELGGMRAAQSQMGEDLRVIKGMLGLVSPPPSPPSTPTPLHTAPLLHPCSLPACRG